MKLLLTTTGTAQLLDESERHLWSSDSDDAFKDEFGDDFLSEDDVEDIFEFLVDHNIVEDEDVEHIEIFEDSLEDDGTESLIGPGDEEDEDEDEEE